MTNDLLSTIPELLQASVARGGDQSALGIVADGEVSWKTWAEVGADVQRFAGRLQRLGIGSGDRVAQWAPNSYGWILADLALLTLGAVHVPLHVSLSDSQAGELLELAEAKLLITDTADRRPAGVEISHQLHDMEGLSAAGALVAETNVCADQLATLLFTSGTTGQPRGVMLSHGNLVSNAVATTEAVGSSARETRLCFLPFSHIYARTCDLYSWLYRGSRLVLAESRETIVRDCQLVRPKVINGVPYFYQKIAQQLHGAEPGRLRELLGGNITRCFCGGAAVAPEVETLFEQQGLPLLSGYGLTEASPVISATAADDYQAGSVGWPLANLEVKLSSQGEILVRGPSVMLGYWNDRKATEAAVVDGWLYTGDLGEIDDRGHLRIAGRQKEVIVLSTGKNISPTRVEQCLAGSPLVEHACVVGDGRKFLTALIVPNPEALRQKIRELRLWVWSRRRAVTHPKIRRLYAQEIERLLGELSAEEQVGGFVILDHNFSVELGELTTKLSLRRGTIAGNFSSEIERMYGS